MAGGDKTQGSSNGDRIVLDKEDPFSVILKLFCPTIEQDFQIGQSYTSIGIFPLSSFPGDSLGLTLYKCSNGYYFVSPTKKGDTEEESEQCTTAFQNSVKSGVKPNHVFFWLKDIPLIAAVLLQASSKKFVVPWFIPETLIDTICCQDTNSPFTSQISLKNDILPSDLGLVNLFFKAIRNPNFTKVLKTDKPMNHYNFYYLVQVKSYYSNQNLSMTLPRTGSFLPLIFEELFSHVVESMHQKVISSLLERSIDPAKFAEDCMVNDDSELINKYPSIVDLGGAAFCYKTRYTLFDQSQSYNLGKLFMTKVDHMHDLELAEKIKNVYNELLSSWSSLDNFKQGIPPNASIWKQSSYKLVKKFRGLILQAMFTERSLSALVISDFNTANRSRIMKSSKNTDLYTAYLKALKDQDLPRSTEEEFHSSKIMEEVVNYINKRKKEDFESKTVSESNPRKKSKTVDSNQDLIKDLPALEE
jgi:hypothetical protein